MPAGADHDTIRRAYAARALALHPDRLVDAGAGERQRAAWKMAEVNEAWAVLRDPQRRAAYDRTSSVARRGFAGGSGAVSRRGMGGAVGGDGGVVEGRPTGAPVLEPELEDAPSALDPAGRWWWSRHAPMLIVGAVVALLVLIGALAMLVGEQSTTTDVETAEPFPVGSCVVVDDEGVIASSGCREFGAQRIIDKVAFPRPCPTGSRAALLWEQSVSLCLVG